MVIWLWLLVGMVLATVVQVVLLERQSRRLQWHEFTRLMREVDGRCRAAGWVLFDASFRPGFIRGRGSATWRRGSESFTSPVWIDGAKTTREAARPW